MNHTLAEITKELLKAFGRHPRKRLGQHFLIDPQVLERIVSAAELNKNDLVIEIGSGLGLLTAQLAKKSKEVVAVEIDKELLKISKDVLQAYQNINFVSQDILKTDLDNLSAGREYKIVGNLPYYITSPVIEKIFKAQNKPPIAILMVQKEVAERMAASPGSKKYGSFSIFVQYHSEIKLHCLVSKSSFHPWPEVSSAIVILKPYKTPKYSVKNEKLFFDIVHAAFGQRRKKIRNSLAKYNLEGLNIELSRRPETLSLVEFTKIANYVEGNT